MKLGAETKEDAIKWILQAEGLDKEKIQVIFVTQVLDMIKNTYLKQTLKKDTLYN